MKSHPSVPASIFIAINLLFVMILRAEAEYDADELEKAFFEEKVAVIENKYAKSIANLTGQYTKALEGRAVALQEKGDLDGLLAIKKELARFRESGRVPAETDDTPNEIITGLQQIYRNAKGKADHARAQSIIKYTNSYLSHLEGLQKKMTQAGKLDEAVKVRDEANRVRMYKSKIETRKDERIVDGNVQPSLTSRKAGNMPIVSWNGGRSSAIKGPDGRASLNYEFNHEGGNKLSDGVLYLKGGRTTVEGLNKRLLDSCMASGELAVHMKFETEIMDQADHARILSYSLNGHQRDFTLCQVKDTLVLRLRTTKTGNNGTNPQITLGQIKKDKLHSVVVCYRPGQLSFYIDGEAKSPQQIEGDFSNWEEHQLVLGNEWKDERPWKGRIHQFAIFSSVIDPEDAVQLTK